MNLSEQLSLAQEKGYRILCLWQTPSMTWMVAILKGVSSFSESGNSPEEAMSKLLYRLDIEDII